MLPLALLGASAEFTPTRPDPLSELHRWKEQPELNQEILYVGDTDADDVIWLAGESSFLACDGYTVDQRFFPRAWPDMGSGKDLLCAANGDVYALYQNGLIRLRPSLEFDLLLALEESASRTTSLAETTDGSVWLGTQDGLYRIESGEAVLMKSALGSIRALQVDKTGNLWVANNLNEVRVFQYTPSEGTPLRLLDEIALPRNLQGSASLIYQKPDGTMWILITDPAWVVIEFKGDLTINQIPVPDGFESALGFDYCPMPDGRVIFTDKSTTAQFYNGQWSLLNFDKYPVATHESFAISLPGNQLLIGGSHTQRYLVDLSNERWTTYLDLIFCDQDTEGKEWFIRKDRQVIVHDPKSGHWSAFTAEDGLIDAPNAIHVASNGTIWVSGMHQRNAAFSYLEGDQWHRHEFPSLGYTFGHLAVSELADGSLLFGNGSDAYYDKRPGGAVLCRPSPDGMEMETLDLPHFPPRPHTLASWRKNALWIGGRDLYFKKTPRSDELSLSDRFNRSWSDHMIVDSSGDLWVANWRLGLFRYDGQDWKEMRYKDSRKHIQATFILEGKHQKGIWIGNAHGLHRFDGLTWSNRVLGKDFRFPKEGTTLAEDNKGNLWLNFGYRDWYLNSPLPHDDQAHVLRTIRYRADKQAPRTEFTRIEGELNEPANAFFSWRGQDYREDTARDKLEYSYRLSGSDWTPYSKQTEVALLHLLAGDYTLEVRARDQDYNVVSSPIVASFRVIPPLWKQPWFVLVLAGVIASTVLLIYIIIRQRIKYALALSELKIDFFTNLSHELRTPLSVILGPLERLIEHAASSKDREYLEMIRRNARKMLGLVSQLLEFRKVELGKLDFHPSAGEVIGFANDALYSLSPLWEQKKQHVQIILDEAPFRCAFDPDKLLRIIDNVLSNAIKYTPEEGSITVRVHVVHDSDNASSLNLRIEDTGVGIPDSRINRITEPFYRAHPSRGDNVGTGIGLALVEEMVRLWKGNMSIESEIKGPRKGTRIEITLPLFPASSEPDLLTENSHSSAIDEPEETHPDSPAGEERKRVLVIEDNPDLRSFLQNELKNHYEVETAENGMAGVDLSLKNPPDLILSDVMMPEMDGIELCKKIRDITDLSHIPIILLTAQTGEAHYLQGIESGADEYFSKPISVPKLIARIENLLQSRLRLHELFAEQIVLEPQKIAVLPSDQRFLQNAIRIAEENMQTEAFDVEAFASQMAVSRSTLNRKIKAITGTSPKAFIRSMRLKRAAHLLASSDFPINEIFFQVGFYDASNFSRIFKKEFGVTPSQYRENHP